MSRAEPVEIPEADWRIFGNSVVVVCPGCREAIGLNHEIDAEGTITPSLDCPICPFHDWGRLVGWTRRDEASDTTPTKGG